MNHVPLESNFTTVSYQWKFLQPYFHGKRHPLDNIKPFFESLHGLKSAPLNPDQGHSVHASSGGLSGMQHPPSANLSRSIASAGNPQTIRLKLPTAPQFGQGEVFTETFFELI